MQCFMFSRKAHKAQLLLITQLDVQQSSLWLCFSTYVNIVLR